MEELKEEIKVRRRREVQDGRGRLVFLVVDDKVEMMTEQVETGQGSSSSRPI